MPEAEEINKKIQEILNQEGNIDNIEINEEKEEEGIINSNIIEEEIKPKENPIFSNEEDDKLPKNNIQIEKTLQPNSKDNGIIYTCISIRFDPDRCLDSICPRVFESFFKSFQSNIENEQEKVPAVFSKIGKDLIKGKIGKLDLSKMGEKKLWKRTKQQKDQIEYKQLDFIQDDLEDHHPMNEEEENTQKNKGKLKFLGVDACKAAKVFGFLEQPWTNVVPNDSIIYKRDVKRIMDQWQAYSQKFMIKLKWMQFITIPLFIRITDHMISKDLPQLSQEDEGSLLSYCLEFWNKPEMNYHWKISLSPTDDTVAIWKTRMVIYFFFFFFFVKINLINHDFLFLLFLSFCLF